MLTLGVYNSGRSRERGNRGRRCYQLLQVHAKRDATSKIFILVTELMASTILASIYGSYVVHLDFIYSSFRLHVLFI